MLELKYIRHSRYGFIVWPVGDGSLWHSDMRKLIDGREGRSGTIVSAGLLSFDKKGAPVCYGRSESLDIESKSDDSLELAIQFGLPRPR